MKITMERWIAACVLGCAFIAVWIIPSGPDSDEQAAFRWQLQRHGLENAVAQRQRALSAHARGLAAVYKSAEDAATARRVFGAARDASANQEIWFAPDVPDRSRRAVTELVSRERAARGEWSRRGPVGILVLTDTFTAIDHVKLPANYDRDRSVTTAVLPATSATGGRCVTVIRLRHRALDQPPALQEDRLPLDGCAFTDAFGTPGANVAEWLRKERYLYARRLAFERPKAELNIKRWPSDEGDIPGRACRGGDDRSCLAEAMLRESRDFWMWYSRRDLSVGVPDESWESTSRIEFYTDVLLESLQRELGPARFQRMWQSPKALPDAYFDQTGATFASWVRARLVRFYGPYRAGPLPAPSANLLTLILILFLAAISVRFAARPSVA